MQKYLRFHERSLVSEKKNKLEWSDSALCRERSLGEAPLLLKPMLEPHAKVAGDDSPLCEAYDRNRAKRDINEGHEPEFPPKGAEVWASRLPSNRLYDRQVRPPTNPAN